MLLSSYKVFLCPLFILRSNLPVPLTIDVVPSNPDATYEVDLFGKGKEVKLLEGLEWDHKLKLKLKTGIMHHFIFW